MQQVIDVEYLDKSEIVEYLKGKEKEVTLEGKDTTVIKEVLDYIGTLYSFRPTLQSQWVMKNENVITCSRCGFRTLSYKNTKYCPECGRLMANGRSNDQR